MHAATQRRSLLLLLLLLLLLFLLPRFVVADSVGNTRFFPSASSGCSET
jgi:hypothetical protein